MKSVDITGIILAGGQGKRMNYQDKGLVNLAGKPLYQHVLARLKPQVNQIIINANRHISTYQSSGYPVIADTVSPQFQGPLAGFITGLKNSQTDWVIFVPCDTPRFPTNLVNKLYQYHQQNQIIFARDKQRLHPVFALIHRGTLPIIENYFEAGQRKLLTLFEYITAQSVQFTDEEGTFSNLNTHEECNKWEQQHVNQ